MQSATQATGLAPAGFPASSVPGRRIESYRNSSPRLIRLIGLGRIGGSVARAIGQRRFPNVDITTGMQPVGWPQLAGDVAGTPVNAIVIVCSEGDEALFDPRTGKPDALVTFVLLQASAGAVADRGMADADRMANAKMFSDLLVTTPDVDYVADLIDNLAS
jgi:hypothetical protein